MKFCSLFCPFFSYFQLSQNFNKKWPKINEILLFVLATFSYFHVFTINNVSGDYLNRYLKFLHLMLYAV